MTYRELMKKLSKLSNEQLDTDISIYNTTECIFSDVINFEINEDLNNSLEEYQPYLVI